MSNWNNRIHWEKRLFATKDPVESIIFLFPNWPKVAILSFKIEQNISWKNQILCQNNRNVSNLTFKLLVYLIYEQFILQKKIWNKIRISNQCWLLTGNNYQSKTVKCCLDNKTCKNNRNTRQFKYISNWLGMKTSQNELKKLLAGECNCWNDNTAWAMKKILLD